MAIDADVVVIGAGAFGLSVALHCALLDRSVVVVERLTAGSQASGRAAALFKSVQADALRTTLARRSIDKVLNFEDWAGVPLDVMRSGSMLIARTDKHKAVLRAETERSRAWGVDLTQTSAADRVAYYRAAGSELAFWCPEDVYIEEPDSLIQAYLAACRRRDVQVLESEPAVSVVTSGGRVSGVETTANRIDAGVVVDAAGAWVRQVAEMARGPFPRCNVAVAPYRHQLLITEPSADVPDTDPVIRVIDAAVYLRPARGGLMAGAFEAGPLPLDPRLQPDAFSTDDVPLDLGLLRKQVSLVADEVPLATRAGVADHRAGLCTMTPDGRFIAGPIPDVPGLWVVSGCNVSGFSFSPAIGEAIAGWIATGQPTPGLEALAPTRFGPVTDEQLIRDGAWQYAHFYDPAALSTAPPHLG
jgi:glycine/D-amino acid oxidase-like deaminating enzyme